MQCERDTRMCTHSSDCGEVLSHSSIAKIDHRYFWEWQSSKPKQKNKKSKTRWMASESVCNYICICTLKCEIKIFLMRFAGSSWLELMPSLDKLILIEIDQVDLQWLNVNCDAGERSISIDHHYSIFFRFLTEDLYLN